MIIGLISWVNNWNWGILFIGISGLLVASVGFILFIVGALIYKHEYIYWVSLLLLLGVPFFFIILSGLTFVNYYMGWVFGMIYLFFVLPIGIVLFLASYVIGRRKKRQQNEREIALS